MFFGPRKRPSSFMNSVIFDTNLLLDFFVFHNPQTSVLWAAAKERKFKTITCEGAVSELEDVLKKPQFKISLEQLEAIKEEFLSVADVLPITTEAKARCKDPLDQKFIDLTLSCSPALLISKDKLVLRCARHLRPLGSNILPPEKAVAFLLTDN